jgi:endonuclease-3
VPSLVKPMSDPFETLIITIISQNTADRNTAVAFENLSNNFEITPEALFKAQISQIEKTIKTAGLYKTKAKTIQQTSSQILKKHNGTIDNILKLPLEEARKTLMQFKGVGPKTADVVLLFSANQPTIPIDTHVNRVTKRLGFTSPKSNYEKTRSDIQRLFNPSDCLKVHLLLIEHGRKVCKAQNPKCSQCPINKQCPSNSQKEKP